MGQSISETRLTVRYFAWVREKVGKGAEEVTLPGEVETIAQLMRWLGARGPEYAEAFRNPAVIRAAIDHMHVKPEMPIGRAREVAFFPPVTGG